MAGTVAGEIDRVRKRLEGIRPSETSGLNIHIVVGRRDGSPEIPALLVDFYGSYRLTFPHRGFPCRVHTTRTKMSKSVSSS